MPENSGAVHSPAAPGGTEDKSHYGPSIIIDFMLIFPFSKTFASRFSNFGETKNHQCLPVFFWETKVKIRPIEITGNFLPAPQPTQGAICAQHEIPQFYAPMLLIQMGENQIFRHKLRKPVELLKQQQRFIGGIEHQVDVRRR